MGVPSARSMSAALALRNADLGLFKCPAPDSASGIAFDFSLCS